jgi:predicted nucleic acid-binding protein
MMATFIDTSFLLAMVLEPDEHHRRALAWRKHVLPPFITTEYVLLEFLDALVRAPLRARAVKTIRELRSDEDLHIVPGNSSLLNEAIELYSSYTDKEWSLTDCASFTVMRREGILQALTSDHDFEQAGFRALLRFDPP